MSVCQLGRVTVVIGRATDSRRSVASYQRQTDLFSAVLGAETDCHSSVHWQLGPVWRFFKK